MRASSRSIYSESKGALRTVLRELLLIRKKAILTL